MTNQSDEPDDLGGIPDELLPEDLQPTDDNPLAQPLEPGEAPDVDLNEPSGTYQRQLEEEDEGSGDQGDKGDKGDKGDNGAPDED